MTKTAVPGPDVRMCASPSCAVPGSCERPGAFMRLADSFPWPVSDDIVVAMFRQELVLNYASDSTGARRMIPDGCEFTVHRSGIPDTGGKRQFIAVYSGPCGDRDEVLAGCPAYDPAEALERVKRMRDAGLFDTVLAWREVAGDG